MNDESECTVTSLNVSRRGHEYGVCHFLAVAEGLLSDVIASTLGLSVESVDAIVQLGGVYLKGERVLSKKELVRTGEYLRVHTTPRRFPIHKINIQDIKVFENEDFVVVNKPAGVPVHATVDNWCENIIFELNKVEAVPLKVTHRLDIPTQGLLVLAKSRDFQRQFNTYLAQAKVKKIYRATVQGENIRDGRWTHWMEPSPRAPKVIKSEPQPGWLRCSIVVLEVERLSAGVSRVLIELETGRTHQIRAQLSYAGYPIAGDGLYGSQVKLSNEHEEIDLQCCRLQFPPSYSFSL